MASAAVTRRVIFSRPAPGPGRVCVGARWRALCDDATVGALYASLAEAGDSILYWRGFVDEESQLSHCSWSVIGDGRLLADGLPPRWASKTQLPP